jgi:uncharacterized cupredoxin-like copper-binding protein
VSARRARALVAAALVAVAAGAAANGLTDGDDAGAARDDVLGPGPVTVMVEIEHSRFSTDRVDVVAGTDVRFVLVNDDPILHELIVGPPEVHARHADGTEAQHPPVPGEVTVEPGQIASTTYRFDEPGTVTFACHLPRHLDYGMVGEVVVHPA